MARPPKTLERHLREGTFRARRHHQLLNGPVVAEERLRRLQSDYKAAATERERRAIALEFQEAASRADDPDSVIARAVGKGTPPLAIADFFERTSVTQTSVEQIDRTYGHLLPDALERTRAALDTFLTNPQNTAEREAQQ